MFFIIKLSKKDVTADQIQVVITYTQGSSENLVDELISKIKALDNGSTAIKVQAELRDANSPEKIVAATREAYGDHIDILINNAGTGIVRSFLECTPEDYDYVVNLNLRSLFFMTKAVVRHLRSPGRIVNVSSISARAPFSNTCLYIASKAGVEGLTRALAAELGPLGHTINSVSPGPVQRSCWICSRRILSTTSSPTRPWSVASAP